MVDKESELKEKKIKIDDNCIFSKEKVNTGRQPEVDYLKTLGIFLIILSHVYDNFSKGCLEKIIYFLSFILGAGGAMLLMGMGMKYSKHHEPKYYIARGFGLLTIGQYLNFLRDCLPNLISYWITGNKNFIARSMQILQADILTFAGFAFLLLALMKKIKLSDNLILFIGIIMNIIAFPLFKIMKSPDSFLLSQFLGFFVLTKAEAYFPLCSYFVFVAFGNWLGGIYQNIANKHKFHNRVLIFCLPIVSIYYYFRSHYDFPILPEYMSVEDYCLCPGPDAIVSCLANLTGLSFYYKIDELFKGKTPEVITHAGKNFNQYYMLSYIIIQPMQTFLIAAKGEDFPFKMKYPTLMAFMVLVLCKILIDMNDKYIHFTISTLKNPMRNIVFALIWIVTIISVIYIYPRIEVYATLWNDYLYED